MLKNTHWDGKGLFWRRQQEALADASLRSITPHIVRSRLTLFGNVLVDQKHALAVHNVHRKCTIHDGLGRLGNCGSIHFGFCKSVEQPKTKEPDVKTRVERLESELKSSGSQPSTTSSSQTSRNKKQKEPPLTSDTVREEVEGAVCCLILSS